jgi:hypothetical protein
MLEGRFGIWGLCYILQPVQRGLLVAKLAKPGAFESAMVLLPPVHKVDAKSAHCCFPAGKRAQVFEGVQARKRHEVPSLPTAIAP